MNDFLESRICRLTCVAPVHIGSGEVLKSFEYLYDKARQKVYFLNEGKWAQFLASNKLLDEFTAVLGRNGNFSRINIWQWLQDKGFSAEDCDEFIKRKAFLKADLSDKKGTLNDISTGVCDGIGSLYVPGSSIKGMLRTGIIFYLLEHNPGMKAKFCKEMCNALQSGNLKRSLGALSNKMEETLLAYKDDKGNVHKLLAGLQVGDALAGDMAAEPVSVILQRVDGSTYGGRSNQFEKHLPLYWECIPAGSEFELRISMDRAMLQKIGIGSIEEIFGYCRSFMQRGLKLQEKVFGRRYDALFDEAKAADCFLGAGTGFLQKSLWFSLFADDGEAMRELKGFLDQSFRQHRHRVLDKDISPRTIKLAVSGRRQQMMGLCKLEVMHNA